MEIKRVGSQPSGKGPTEYFSGTVRITRTKRQSKSDLPADVTPRACERSSANSSSPLNCMSLSIDCSIRKARASP